MNNIKKDILKNISEDGEAMSTLSITIKQFGLKYEQTINNLLAELEKDEKTILDIARKEGQANYAGISLFRRLKNEVNALGGRIFPYLKNLK